MGDNANSSREPLVSTLVAAAEFGLSARTLQRHAAAGSILLSARLPSGHMRWRVSELAAQLGVA